MSKKSKKKELLDDAADARKSASSPDMLSEDELKILVAMLSEEDRGELPHYDNSDLAKAKRYAKKNKFTVLFVTMTILLVIAVIALLSVFLYRELANAPSTEDFTLTLGEDETVIKYKSAMRDNVLYLDVIPIARYTELVVSGGNGSLKITAHDGSSIRFENGENYAYVNGDKVRLEGVAKIQLLDGDGSENIACYIPFSFIERMFACGVEKGTPSVYVSFSNKTNKILFHKITYNDTEKALPVHFSIDCFDILAT
jgi:hypothetical protein